MKGNKLLLSPSEPGAHIIFASSEGFRKFE